MIEKVAESQANFDGRKLINMPAGERERYRQRARLAIEAMLEPSEAMMASGTAANDRYALEVAPCSAFRANDSYRAMISAALNEEGEK